MKNLVTCKSILSKWIFFLSPLLLSYNLYSAQNYQITYEVQFKPIKGSDKLIKEYMALKIVNDQSLFYNMNKERIDSLVNKYDYKGASSITSSFLRIKVFKDYSNDYSIIGGNFNQFNYWYKENKISYHDLKKFGKYKTYSANEAFADFGKRKWHILYTTDIPMNDGPYVFSGLPGLVIKAESLNGDYSFELIEVKNLRQHPEMKVYKENIKKGKLIKHINDFIMDPASHQINFKNDSGDTFNYKYSGSRDTSYHKTNKYIKDIIQKFNNYPDQEVPIITF